MSDLVAQLRGRNDFFARCSTKELWDTAMAIYKPGNMPPTPERLTPAHPMTNTIDLTRINDLNPDDCALCGHDHGGAFTAGPSSEGGEPSHDDFCDCSTVIAAERFRGRAYDPRRPRARDVGVGR